MGYSVMDAAPTGAGASFGIKGNKVTGVMISGPATDQPLRFWNYNWMVDSGGGAQWTPLAGGGRISGLIVPIQPGGAAPIGPPAPFEIVITDCTAANNPQFSEANPATAASPSSSAASPGPSSGFAANWAGTWQSDGAGGPATVHLVSVDPIVGSITVPGWCTADWQETQRISASSRLVHAHVTSGSCGDNTWAVTIQPNTSLTGVDHQHPGTTFSFSPS